MATKADALGVATVHVRTWQVAYRGLMPEDFLAGLSVDEREQRWRGVLPEAPQESTTATVPRCTWVGVNDYVVVGFCALGPSRDPGETGAEVYALYVLPAYWRGGLGGRLLTSAEDLAQRAGSPSLSLWTLRDNPRARGFYERMGYETDGGARDEAVGGVTLGHLRYRKTLGHGTAG